MGLRA
jgi:hypothetical protein